MSGLNKAMLIGNLGRDPETRNTRDGEIIVSLSIATGEAWKDKTTGERRERTEWHRVVIFNPNLAKIAEQYLKKGSKVYVEGELRTREWEKDGVKRQTTEIVLSQYRGQIVLLDGFSAAPGGGTGGASAARGADFDDAIPF